MNKIYKQNFIYIIISVFTIYAQNIEINYEKQDTFFLSLISRLKTEYFECTGDTLIPETNKLLEWKNSIHKKTDTKEYSEMLKEYMAITGIIEDIMPCHVLNWNLDRLNFIKNSEIAISKRITTDSDLLIDSISFFIETTQNPPSVFDFDSIPFGFSKKGFIKFFKKRTGLEITNEDSIFTVDHFIINETPFMLKFVFNDEDKLSKYYITTYSYTGNELNTKVRDAASIMFNTIKKTAGEPNRINRIGYFDIKPGSPMIYSLWNRETHYAKIYFIQKNGKFSAETEVAKKNPSKKE